MNRHARRVAAVNVAVARLIGRFVSGRISQSSGMRQAPHTPPAGPRLALVGVCSHIAAARRLPEKPGGHKGREHRCARRRVQPPAPLGLGQRQVQAWHLAVLRSNEAEPVDSVGVQ